MALYFFGGVHDFSSLMLSIKNDGKTIGDTAEKVIGVKAKIIFSLFLWLTLYTTPEIVIPTFGIIPIAIIVGFMLYK